MLPNKHDLSTMSFVLPTTVGDKVTLINQQKTIIYFFAPWCQICHASIDNLQAIYQSNTSLKVIAVALDFMTVEEVEKFVAKHQLTFPVAIGNEEVKQAFKVHAYPSYYVVDKKNIVIAKAMGYSTEIGLYLRSL
ncbi:TlpA disulfide reductase family protein [Colwelliaceae bacterium 6441]